MDCRQTRDWLLQTEDPRPERCDTPALAAHLAVCADCRRLAERLRRLEQAWRDVSLPAADRARAAFRQRLPGRTAATPRIRRLSWSQRMMPRWAAAALLFLTLGLASGVLLSPGETYAGSDVVDRLLDWNLDLAQAPAADRQRIYVVRAAALQEAVRRTPPAGADHTLAEALLANGAWLADHADPLAAADRFSQMADQLVERMRKAVAQGNSKKTGKLAQRYRRLVRRGIDANLKRTAGAGADPARTRRLERIRAREARQVQALEELLERVPDASQKEIRRALAQARKPFKHKGAAAGDGASARPRGKGQERRPPD